MENGIRKEVDKGQLLVSRVFTNTFQKDGTVSAELRQSVVTTSFYPSKQIANNYQDNVFDVADFGFEEQEFENTEKRVTWIDVPEGTSQAQVEAKLAEAGSAGLYRVLSNHPILTSGQIYAINNELTTKDTIAESQVVRMPEGAEDGAGNDVGGALALDPNGKPQYRAIFFSIEGKVDDDRRNTEAEDFYTTELINSEMSTVEENVSEGQTITM